MVTVLLGAAMSAAPAPATAAVAGGDCSNTSTGATPISDLGADGALYFDSNTMPAAHSAAAPAVLPIDGTIGMASIGMSNAVLEWERFREGLAGTAGVSPAIKVANGALGGTPMADWANPEHEAWSLSLQRLADDGMAPHEVQVLWVKMGSQLGQLFGDDFDTRVEKERAWLNEVLVNAAATFPNLKRAYFSSRIYAGYGDNPNHSEPETGYDNGFAVRAVVDDSVQGIAPVWAAWGPYLWADGLVPRNDGFFWECADFAADGIHPSGAGQDKIAEMLHGFFSTDPTTCGWYLEDPSGCGAADPLDLGPFADVPHDDTFVDDIAWLAESGITFGCNPPANTLFCPDDDVTREQMAAFLVRALHLPSGEETFVDDDGSLFEAEIEALAAAEITLGCNPPSNDMFCPDDFITRGQMAAFLVRALALPEGTERFTDDNGSLFEAEIEALAAAEITLGCNPPSNDMFCPDDFVTRKEMAAFLHRAAAFFP